MTAWEHMVEGWDVGDQVTPMTIMAMEVAQVCEEAMGEEWGDAEAADFSAFI